MAHIVDPKIETYAFTHSTPADELLADLEQRTFAEMDSPGMLAGTVQGRFLQFLVRMTGAKSVLEVGMFTGYSALSMAAALPDDGELVTLELSSDHIRFASAFFKRSPHGKKIRVIKGSAREIIKGLTPPFDFVYIDADKLGYPLYYEEGLRLLRSGGFMALDNMLWSGKVLDPPDEETRTLDALNRTISLDPRVEAVLLTIRDGVQLVRKK